MRISERTLTVIVVDEKKAFEQEITKKRFTEFIVKLLVTQALIEIGEPNTAAAVWEINP